MIIENGGGGASAKAKVDSLTNRLWTRAISEPEAVEAAIEGDQFIITSGAVTLTSASASAVFYYQNDESVNLIMSRIVFSAGVSTSGTTNVCNVAAKINPTGLGSGSGSDLSIINSNFGSSKTLTATNSEIGAEAATVTGGSAGPSFFFPDKLTSTFDTFVILEPGSSIAFTVTPPASNSSLLVSVAINAHKQQGI
jgi:hypothetical protein